MPAKIGVITDVVSVKETWSFEPMTMFGGSPTSVAVPPIVEQSTWGSAAWSVQKQRH